jgi:hypothetical protein
MAYIPTCLLSGTSKAYHLAWKNMYVICPEYEHLISSSQNLAMQIEAAAFFEYIEKGSLLTPEKLHTQFAAAGIAEVNTT